MKKKIYGAVVGLLLFILLLIAFTAFSDVPETFLIWLLLELKDIRIDI